MSELHWYYAVEGVATGPRSEAEMIELVRSGKVSSSTLIWQPALSEWESVEKIQAAWLKVPAPANKPQSVAEPVAVAVATADKKTAPVLVAKPSMPVPSAPKPGAGKATVPLSSKPGLAPVPQKKDKAPDETVAEKKGGLFGKLFKR